MNMNYFDVKTLIAQDPEGDGIEGNDFHTAFINGNLPDEYYEGINGDVLSEEEWTQRNIDNATKTGPMAAGGTYEEYKKDQMSAQKMDPKTLQAWLDGEDNEGTKDYNNLTDRKGWIIDKFSKYMGQVTTEGYNAKQKSELEKQNRYFQLPGEDGAFMGKGGNAPTNEVVAEKKLEVYKNLKFETVLGENYDAETTNFTDILSDGEDSSLFTNIQASYKTHIENDELDIDVDDGVMTIKTKDGGEATFDFVNDPTTNQPRTKESQIKLMKKLEDQLGTLGPIDMELNALGNNANEWNMNKGAILPANATIEAQREQGSQTAANQSRNQALDTLVEERGSYTTQTDPNGGGLVYFFEDGTTVSENTLGTNFNVEAE